MSWTGDTTVYASLIRARRAASASLRVQTTTVGLPEFGPRDTEKLTRRAPLGGYVLVDPTAAAAAQQQQ